MECFTGYEALNAIKTELKYVCLIGFGEYLLLVLATVVHNKFLGKICVCVGVGAYLCMSRRLGVHRNIAVSDMP